jgi:hypothetical protein
VIVQEFGTGDVLWSMLWFFLAVIWVMLLFTVFADIFRSDELSGGGKALWTLFVIVLPYLGVFVYLIARGRHMTEHNVRQAQARDEAMRNYVRSVAGTSATPAEELAKLAELEARGAITHEDFVKAKVKILS